MSIHEYQGKELLRRHGVATPRGIACFSVAEAALAADELGGATWVVKAQIHARGKGGGVKLARSTDEVREHAGGKGTAQEKLAVMEECGIRVTRNPAEMGRLLASVL
jgi:succinyl-CoA synthetase beta subunit